MERVLDAHAPAEVEPHDDVAPLVGAAHLQVAAIAPGELDEVARLSALAGAEINEAKKILATEASALVHGRDKADAAAETARKTFEQGTLAEDLPAIEVPRSDIANELGVLAAFVTAGLVKSNSEARRQVQGGGLKVNDVVVTDEKAKLRLSDIGADGVIKLSLGRKKHILLRPV